MHTFGSPQRFLLSYCAAIASVLHVVIEHHVHINILDPSTYNSLFEHKCGMVMVACILWALAETAVCLVPRSGRNRDSYRGMRGGSLVYSARVLR